MCAAIETDTDHRFMNAALALGRRGLGACAPNPSVGALVVKDGIVVGRGWTGLGGRPHAETIALDQAGIAARGATIYVTLEPCAHHGRTPPCCEAIVAAGVARVVYAIDDPNPAVAGRGAALCRAHGLTVVTGVGAAAAGRDHRGHVLRMTQGRPMVTLKLAQTADGYVAGGPHDARLSITGVAANGHVHVLRAMHDAIMVGSGTALADDPLMTVRLAGVAAKPLRVVLDGSLRLSPASRLARTASDVPVLVLTTAASLFARGGAFDAIAGLELAAVETGPDGRIDLGAALRLLGARGITRVFSEGGPAVGSALIAGGLAESVLLFNAPKPLGFEGVPALDAAARAILRDPRRYTASDPTMIGVDRLQSFERQDAHERQDA
jgi:diaminohydroxyphosphoribosylaminopyrimidine deaminase/5-amino-6-(5-phosphoribosylamino)uracil reductase